MRLCFCPKIHIWLMTRLKRVVHSYNFFFLLSNTLFPTWANLGIAAIYGLWVAREARRGWHQWAGRSAREWVSICIPRWSTVVMALLLTVIGFGYLMNGVTTVPNWDYYKYNTLFFISATYISFLNLFSVYTTVFVDRSLTYHMICYSVETGQITQSDIKTLFSSETYQAQRIQDMTDSGFVVTYSDFLGLCNRYREATQPLTGRAPHGK